MIEDEMVGWHHELKGHEFAQAPGDGEGQEPCPWTARRSNQSMLKKINPEYSLEGLMLKLKLQHFGHLMGRADSLEKTLENTRKY